MNYESNKNFLKLGTEKIKPITQQWFCSMARLRVTTIKKKK